MDESPGGNCSANRLLPHAQDVWHLRPRHLLVALLVIDAETSEVIKHGIHGLHYAALVGSTTFTEKGICIKPPPVAGTVLLPFEGRKDTTGAVTGTAWSRPLIVGSLNK